ncbi:MAG: DRTGG domain-containing protein [Anaerolineae bacterium]
MKVQDLVQALSLEVLVGGPSLDRPVTGGYASDLLSRVMAMAKAGNVWVTLQGHPNVVAVALLLDLAAVIVTEGSSVEPGTVQRAQERGVVLLRTPHDTFTVVAKLAQLGVEGAA